MYFKLISRERTFSYLEIDYKRSGITNLIKNKLNYKIIIFSILFIIFIILINISKFKKFLKNIFLKFLKNNFRHIYIAILKKQFQIIPFHIDMLNSSKLNILINILQKKAFLHNTSFLFKDNVLVQLPIDSKGLSIFMFMHKKAQKELNLYNIFLNLYKNFEQKSLLINSNYDIGYLETLDTLNTLDSFFLIKKKAIDKIFLFKYLNKEYESIDKNTPYKQIDYTLFYLSSQQINIKNIAYSKIKNLWRPDILNEFFSKNLNYNFSTIHYFNIKILTENHSYILLDLKIELEIIIQIQFIKNNNILNLYIENYKIYKIQGDLSDFVNIKTENNTMLLKDVLLLKELKDLDFLKDIMINCNLLK
jgi:hypothetical protein